MPNDPQARELTIFGAGTYAEPIRELAESCGYVVTRYLDDDPQRIAAGLDGIPTVGPISDALPRLPSGTSVAVAIGNNDVRLRLLRQARELGLKTPALVSPLAMVSRSAAIEEAVYLHPGCHVWSQASVGYGTILSPAATVAHHTTLGAGCFVSTGAHVGASISVGGRTMIGIGATVSTGVTTIGDHSLIGAGAVVIRDTERHGVYVGNPARIIRAQKA